MAVYLVINRISQFIMTIDLKKWTHLPTDNDFIQIETYIGTSLPLDYKSCMRIYNNIAPRVEAIYCYDIKWEDGKATFVRQGIIEEWLPIYSGTITIDHGEGNPASTLPTLLDALNNYRDKDFPRVPINTIPIGDAGDGDKILMGIGEQNNGIIYYWVMNFEEEYDEPGISPSYDNIGFIASSFTEFLKSLYHCEEE